MSSSLKRKRVVLSLQQKLDIIRRLDQGESAINLAQEYNVGKTSVTDIKMRKDKIINYVTTFKNSEGIHSRKTMKSVYNKELDRATYEWYMKREKSGFPVTSQELCEKALEFNRMLNGSPDFKASGSWLRNFKARHGLNFPIQCDSITNLLSSIECDTLSNLTNSKEANLSNSVSPVTKINENIPTAFDSRSEEICFSDNLPNHVLNQNFPNTNSKVRCDSFINVKRSCPHRKRKRVVLSLKQKIDILRRIQNGESESSLAKEYNIANSSLKGIKTNQHIILDYVSSFENIDNMNLRKTMKTANNTDLDEAVFAWYKQIQTLGQVITGQQICDKALELNKEFGKSPDFKASNGWLKNFKSRHGLPTREYAPRTKNNESDTFLEESSVNFSQQEFESYSESGFSLSVKSENMVTNEYENAEQNDYFPTCDVILTVPEDSNQSDENVTDIDYGQPLSSQLMQSFNTVIDYVNNMRECSSLDVQHLLKLQSMAHKKEMSVAFSSNDSDVINKKVDAVAYESRHPSIPIDEMYEIERCTNWIKNNNYSKVALQFPDSMLNDATVVCLKLSSLTEQEIFVLGDTSYGSCCVDEVTAEHVSADAIIHFGHSCLSPTKRLPMLYVFGKQIVDVEDAANACKSLFPDTKAPIIIIYEVMYAYAIDNIIEKLKDYENLISSKLIIPGDVNTTSYTSEPNDNFVQLIQSHRHITLPKSRNINEYSVFYIGSREVTLNNIMLSMKHSLFHSYNPLSKKFQIEGLDVNRHLKRRYYYIEKAKDAKIIGILVGTLGVADYMIIIKHLKKLIKSAGKKSYTLAIGKLNVAKLANFAEIEVFVNVACPESSLVESRDFYQSIITPFELEVALNEAREWTGDYETDFREILPGAASYIAPIVKTEVEGDVSLISGKLRQAGIASKLSNPEVDESAVVKRNDMELSTVHVQGSGEFLTQRTWKGLEQHLGETPVSDIEQGQRGIACKYEGEKSN